MKFLKRLKNLEWNFKDWKILLNILSLSINIDCIFSPSIMDTAKKYFWKWQTHRDFVQIKS